MKDLFWLAGLLEGEGSFGLLTRRDQEEEYKVPYLVLGMSDKDVVEKAAVLMNYMAGTKIKVWRRQRNPTYKQMWNFTMKGSGAMRIAHAVYPTMGKRRREQIDRMGIAFAELPGSGRKRNLI